MYRVSFAIALAVIRIFGHKSPTFQAIAHIFVGYLLGAWWVGMNDALTQKDKTLRLITGDSSASLNLKLAILLSLVELICFLYFKFAV